MTLDLRIQAVIQALAEQRTTAADMVANMSGEIAHLREQVRLANEKIAELTAKLPAREK